MQANYTDREQINGCLGKVLGEWGGMDESKRKLLKVMDMFTTLIMVMASLVHMYVKINQIVYFKYVQFIICQLVWIKETVKEKNNLLLYPQNQTVKQRIINHY